MPISDEPDGTTIPDLETRASKRRPKYISRAAALERVEGELRRRVSSRVWLPGYMLPSRRALAVEFDVDLHTVQRAIVPLLGDGTLRADGGRGTFVAETSPQNQRPQLPSLALRAAGNHKHPGDSLISLGTIGVITAFDESRRNVDDIAGVGSQEIVRSLERHIAEAGGKSLVYNLLRHDGAWVTVPTATEALIGYGIDALVVIGIDHDPVLKDVRIPEWFNRSLPVVHISGEGDYKARAHVYYDNVQAGFQAAEHLMSIGCRKIVFLVPYTVPWLDDRLEGARSALKADGLDDKFLTIYPPDHAIDQWSENAEKMSEEAVIEAFDRGLFSDGVIAPNDGAAMQVIRHAEQYGKIVGKDFALIGFDDIPSARSSGLTSLRPPFEAMGREAAGLLARLLTGERLNIHLCLPSHLIIRTSTDLYTARNIDPAP